MDSTTILKLVIPALTGLGAWALRNLFVKINKLCDDVLTIKVVLMGPEGENGLRSDVKSVIARVDSLESRLDKAGV